MEVHCYSTFKSALEAVTELSQREAGIDRGVILQMGLPKITGPCLMAEDISYNHPNSLARQTRMLRAHRSVRCYVLQKTHPSGGNAHGDIKKEQQLATM